MTKNPSRKWSKAFVLIIPLVTRMHISISEIVVVCHSRNPTGMRIILPQVIQLQIGEWEIAAVYRRFGGVGIQVFFDDLNPLPVASNPELVITLANDHMRWVPLDERSKSTNDILFPCNLTRIQWFLLPKGTIISRITQFKIKSSHKSNARFKLT